MKFKIGSKVIINKKSATEYSGETPSWYSTTIFTVIGFHKTDDVIILDRDLSDKHGPAIHKKYLTLIQEERKNKILKLENIYHFSSYIN